MKTKSYDVGFNHFLWLSNDFMYQISDLKLSHGLVLGWYDIHYLFNSCSHVNLSYIFLHI